MDEIINGIKKIMVGQRLVAEGADIRGTKLLGGGCLVDSLSAVKFITAVEEWSGADIMFDLNLDNMESVESLAKYIADHKKREKTVVGHQLIIDATRCDEDSLNDLDQIVSLVRDIAAVMGTEILEEGSHVFSPIGITAFAIVSASHIAAHTWPEHGYLGVDVFSCRQIDRDEIIRLIKKYFDGAEFDARQLERKAGPASFE
ncbi:MAG: adenosylmethionine decarboxylase [Defluviitaleaceae bacterium]|nr:adenosylmethionine decarboxylase [Defluviitaleaceae bacterium]